MEKSYKEIMNHITTFVLDVDGVLTDGTVHITEEGQMLRQMNIKDGYALKTAIDNNYKICIISGGKSNGVQIRLNNLGITEVHLGVKDKVAILEKFIQKNLIDPQHILYMGDDIPDYKTMKMVGLPCCPQDAAPEIKKISKYISHIAGGKGAVRDVIEQVMKVQGKWFSSFDAQYD